MSRSGTRLLHATWNAHRSPVDRFLASQKASIKHSVVSRPGNSRWEMRWEFRAREPLNNQRLEQTRNRRRNSDSYQGIASQAAEKLVFESRAHPSGQTVC